MSQTRRLAAILAADVVGYSRLIGADEEGTLNRLRSIRGEVIDPKITEYRGRIVRTTGDGLLVEFSSVVDALRCATEWQHGMNERNADVPPTSRIEFRMGINVGDVVVEDGDIFGDGVNVAARLEGLAEPGGICVSARVQEDVAGRLDLIFDELGEQKLKNIARPVQVYRVRVATIENTSKGTPTESGPALTLPDKPSIAVLPFVNLSGDAQQEYFVDGMVDEIITALSRIRWLFVIARNSSFAFKGQAIDVKRIGRELGVRYVLEGSVRKAGQRVRITGQLIDAVTGTHLWADRFDGSLENVFDLQDKVASSVAGVIEPALEAAEIGRLVGRPTRELAAYDLYLRALPHAYSWDKRLIVQAIGLLGQASERDPSYGPALALAAYCHRQLDLSGWADNSEMNRRQSLDLARRGVLVAPNDPGVLGHVAFVLGYFGEDIDSAIGMIDRCLALNPSFARGWMFSGFLRLYAGRSDLAITHLEISLPLNPRDRRALHLTGIGIALFFDRRFDEALEKLLAALQEFPGYATPYRLIAACHAQTGRLDEARKIVERLRMITPTIVHSATQYRNPEQRELFLSVLRLAAGEAT
ncbi:MAG TPA: adenylate/guanylate cyclase domain-containing protein [Steroidobacteraceae bacterium]|nr:adenylate/guanylate cyclase domain-containing protein [Steroidobacteraceae bacterium]